MAKGLTHEFCRDTCKYIDTDDCWYKHCPDNSEFLKHCPIFLYSDYLSRILKT